jgi:hypothetical protein
MTLMNYNAILTNRVVLFSALALSMVLSYRNLGGSLTMQVDGRDGSSDSTLLWPDRDPSWWESNNLTMVHKEIQSPVVEHKQQQQQQQPQPQKPPPRRCAINLYGLPRSFRHYVLPSLIENVLHSNRHYKCDYFVHFFNKTSEEGGRSGVNGKITPTDVYLLKDAVHQQQQQQQEQQPEDNSAASNDKSNNNYIGNDDDDYGSDDSIVRFVADTDADFEVERKDAINQIVHNNKNHTVGGKSNPYMIHKMGTSTLLNVLKMWHSQTKVWDLMEQYATQRLQREQQQRNGRGDLPIDKDAVVRPYYERVAMLRLDVIYMTPIDIYRVPDNPLPRDKVVVDPMPWPTLDVIYFWDNGTSAVTTVSANSNNTTTTTTATTTNAMTIRRYRNRKYSNNNNNNNVVIPLFASYPVNDRFIAGPYDAVKIWAKGRWSRAYQHVHKVLPKYGLQKFGLHDERIVALTLIPEMQRMGQGRDGQFPWDKRRNTLSNSTVNDGSDTDSTHGPINVHADPAIYFLRVRANGAIWIRDSPILNGEESDRVKLEAILGRSCTVPFMVKKVVSAGQWQIKCPIA